LKAGYLFTLFPAPTRNGEVFNLKCMSLVIIDANYGTMIFDTGSPHNPEEFLYSLKHEFDINPDDVKWIFNTHIHPDHIGANSYFKKAKIVFSRNDFEFSRNIAEVVFSDGDLMSYLHEKCPGYRNSFDDFETDNMKYFIKKYWDEEKIGIKSNPSFIEDVPDIPDFIKVIPSFGHTYFHYCFLIKNDLKDIFVTGDAVSTRLTLNGNREIRLLEPHMDFDKYFSTLEKFQEYDGIFVPGHDRPFFSKTKDKIKEQIFLNY
jgi:glyoxylase-like metal-dependent hydrolase (beta-lactamase superfamily II)